MWECSDRRNNMSDILNYYTPERLEPSEAPAGDCHRLFQSFTQLMSQFSCHGDAVCLALEWSDAMTQGFVIDEAKKDMAQIYFAAHLLETGEVAAAISKARGISAARGNAPALANSSPTDTAWLASTQWGLLFLGMVELNPRLGFIVV